MYYMNAFNEIREDNMIMYWDEPTITMDYDDTHEYHSRYF